MYKGNFINGKFEIPGKVDLDWKIVSPADLNDSIIEIAAIWIAAGNTSLEDWPKLTWSFG